MVRESNGPTFWAVVLPILAIALFAGAQAFLPDRWSWTRYCKMDPLDDTFALANYGAVLVAAIVGMGLGMQSGLKTFAGRVVAGSLLAFALSLGANGAYTHFKPKIARSIWPQKRRLEEGPEEEGPEKGPELEDGPDLEEGPEPQEREDAFAAIRAAQNDSDGQPLLDGPLLDLPVENGTYESHIVPGSRAIGASLGDTCITGCSLTPH